MSGLAFSTVLLFCFLLPGVIFYTRYVKASVSRMISSANEISTTWVLGAAVSVSLVFHVVWGGALHLLAPCFPEWGLRIDYRLVSTLLLGEHSEWVRSESSGNFWFLLKSTMYLSSQYLAAWVGGFQLGETLEQNLDWSHKRALKDNGATWHRLLYDRPRTADGWDVVVATLWVQDSGMNPGALVRGIVDNFDQDQNGDLLRLVLAGAHIRSNPSQTDAHEADEQHEQVADAGQNSDDRQSSSQDGWVQLPGEYFVVNCKSVQTVDIDYFKFT